MHLEEAFQLQLRDWQSNGYVPPAKMLLEFRRMLFGGGGPQLALEGIKVYVGRLYYDAENDQLWVYDREGSYLNRPRSSASDSPQWLHMNEGMARGNRSSPPMPLFKFYYDTYHGSSSLQSPPLDFSPR